MKCKGKGKSMCKQLVIVAWVLCSWCCKGHENHCTYMSYIIKPSTKLLHHSVQFKPLQEVPTDPTHYQPVYTVTCNLVCGHVVVVIRAFDQQNGCVVTILQSKLQYQGSDKVVTTILGLSNITLFQGYM